MKIMIEKTEEGFKYGFGVKFNYTLDEMPDKELIKLSYKILGYTVNTEFVYEFPFYFTSKEELSSESILKYIEEYTESLIEQGFREESIAFIQSVIFADIDEKLKGLK